MSNTEIILSQSSKSSCEMNGNDEHIATEQDAPQLPSSKDIDKREPRGDLLSSLLDDISNEQPSELPNEPVNQQTNEPANRQHNEQPNENGNGDVEDVGTNGNKDEELPPEITDDLRKELHSAASSGDIDELEDLLDDPTTDINVIWFGENLLMTAIRANQHRMAEFLIDNGCNVNFVCDRVIYEKDKRSRIENDEMSIDTTCLVHYSTTAREMAYDRGMLDIVDLIDYKNDCLFPTIKWPQTRLPLLRRTPEERGKIFDSDAHTETDTKSDSLQDEGAEVWVGNNMEEDTGTLNVVVPTSILKRVKSATKNTEDDRGSIDTPQDVLTRPHSALKIELPKRPKVVRHQPVIALNKSATQRINQSQRQRRASDNFGTFNQRFTAQQKRKPRLFAPSSRKVQSPRRVNLEIGDGGNMNFSSQIKTRHISPFSEDLSFNSFRTTVPYISLELPNRRTSRLQSYIVGKINDSKHEQLVAKRQKDAERRRRVLSAPHRRINERPSSSVSAITLPELRRSTTDIRTTSSLSVRHLSTSALNNLSASTNLSRTTSRLSLSSNLSPSPAPSAKPRVRFAVANTT